jgi:hypothetical protein
MKMAITRVSQELKLIEHLARSDAFDVVIRCIAIYSPFDSECTAGDLLDRATPTR